jgi:hypothetical protein
MLLESVARPASRGYADVIAPYTAEEWEGRRDQVQQAIAEVEAEIELRLAQAHCRPQRTASKPQARRSRYANTPAELEELGRPFGLTAQEVEVARGFGMSLSTYKAMKQVASIDDYRRVEAEEAIRLRASNRMSFGVVASR